MIFLSSGETDPAKIAQAYRSIPQPGLLAGNMAVLNGSVLIPPASLPVSGITIINGTIVASVAGNALTLAVKTLAGADPSTDDPVIFITRSATASSGIYTARQVTSALSIAAPSGASFGHASARDQQLIVYAIDNAGTIELALATPLFDQSVRLKTTTAIGAGSTSATTMYSTSARTNVAWAPVARLVSNQTTAGTWANGPAASAPGILQIDIAPFTLPVNSCRIYLNVDQTGVANSTHTKCNYDTVDFDPDSIADIATNHRIQPKVPGTYRITARVWMTGTGAGEAVVSIAKNGTRTDSGFAQAGSNNETNCPAGCLMAMNGTSDYMEATGLLIITAGTVTFAAGPAAGAGPGLTALECHRVGP
jgi:hypothetical protein